MANYVMGSFLLIMLATLPVTVSVIRQEYREARESLKRLTAEQRRDFMARMKHQTLSYLEQHYPKGR